MSMKMTTTQKAIDDYLEERIKRAEEAVIYNLQYIGEQVLNRVRTAGSYQDRTGNLRSSTGYVIVRDGRIVSSSDFSAVKTGGKGSKDGKSFAKSLAARYSEGIVLIVVAGMSYAYYVKKRGYDVLDSGELLADDLVPRMLRGLGFRV